MTGGEANLSQPARTFTAMSQSIEILGEDVESLIGVLPYFETTKTRSGAVNVSAEVPLQVIAPFLRALMRKEARLLMNDADQVTEDAREPRTPDQRRADAFVALVMTISAANRYS